MTRLLASLLLLVACATPRVPSYSESCNDPAHPCSLSYDFEPSAATPDVFGSDPFAFLVFNEDGVVTRWKLGASDAWDHDHVSFARSLAPAINKVEAAAAGVCGGRPVLLASANFMPGRSGRAPERERIVAVVGSLDAPVRPLQLTSGLVAGFGAAQGGAIKIEGLALSPDCRTLLVGVRSVTVQGEEKFVRNILPISLDIDWAGPREDAQVGMPFALGGDSCSGKDEGISDLAFLPDGSLLALTSYEHPTHERTRPEEIAQGDLAGSLFHRGLDGKVTRLACFPGHKPEALAVMPDAKSVRVVFEDDDYGGRPIRAFAVKVAIDR